MDSSNEKVELQCSTRILKTLATIPFSATHKLGAHQTAIPLGREIGINKFAFSLKMFCNSTFSTDANSSATRANIIYVGFV